MEPLLGCQAGRGCAQSRAMAAIRDFEPEQQSAAAPRSGAVESPAAEPAANPLPEPAATPLPAETRWPRAVRLAFLLGAGLALWAAIGALLLWLF